MEQQDCKNLSDVVIQKIQEDILKGKLQEGDKLPPERELTKELGVGRPALREALKSLEMLGLIERRHGLGNYIVNRVRSSYFKPLSLSFMLSKGTYQEIFEMRCCLEIYAAKRAAEIATATDIRRLKNLAAQMKHAEDASAKASFDQSLHSEIVKLSGNILMCDTMENMSYLMDSFAKKSVLLSYLADDSIENIYKEHDCIIDAIANQNPAAAAAAMEKHFENINLAKM